MRWTPCAIALALSAAGVAFGQDCQVPEGALLPDIIVDTPTLLDQEIRRERGKRYLRLSNSTANVGEGPLILRGQSVPAGEKHQPVVQEIYLNPEGTELHHHDAGFFLVHPFGRHPER